MSECKEKLIAKRQDVQGEFDQLESERKVLNERLTAIRERQLHLQGAYQQLTALIEEPNEPPSEECSTDDQPEQVDGEGEKTEEQAPSEG